jgi:hypothetical protein
MCIACNEPSAELVCPECASQDVTVTAALAEHVEHREPGRFSELHLGQEE